MDGGLKRVFQLYTWPFGIERVSFFCKVVMLSVSFYPLGTCRGWMKNHVQNRCQKYGNISSRLRLCMYSSGSIVHTREWERRHILFSVFLLLATVLFRSIPYFLYTNIKTSEVNGVASTKQCNVTCLNIVFEDSAGTLLSHKQTPTSSLFSVINIVFADNNQTLWQYLLFSQKQSCLASTRRCRDNVGLETPCWGKTPRFLPRT